jgi:hypothetical protein
MDLYREMKVPVSYWKYQFEEDDGSSPMRIYDVSVEIFHHQLSIRTLEVKYRIVYVDEDWVLKDGGFQQIVRSGIEFTLDHKIRRFVGTPLRVRAFHFNY